MSPGSVHPHLLACLAFGVFAVLLLAACETGHYPVDIFPEMHYQAAYRAGEPPYAERPANQVPFGTEPSGAIPAPGAEPPVTSMTMLNPVEADGSSISAGRALFATNCSMCHGSNADGNSFVAQQFEANGEKPPPSLRDQSAVQTGTDGTLFWLITNGANRMPSFKRLLSAEERWTIINYIRSL